MFGTEKGIFFYIFIFLFVLLSKCILWRGVRTVGRVGKLKFHCVHVYFEKPDGIEDQIFSR